MNLITKPIAEATAQELRSFAEFAHGLDLPMAATSDQIVAQLRKVGFAGEEIRVFPLAPIPSKMVDGSDAIPARALIIKMHNGVEREYCRILIHTSEKPGGQDVVGVQCNGVAMYIPRGEAVEVPIEYVRILLDGVEHHYPEYRETGLGGLGEPRAIPAYPFSWA